MATFTTSDEFMVDIDPYGLDGPEDDDEDETYDPDDPRVTAWDGESWT